MLVLFTNRKSHTGLSIEPKTVILHDLERRKKLPPTRAISVLAERVICMGGRDATLVFGRDESVTLMPGEAICMPRTTYGRLYLGV